MNLKAGHEFEYRHLEAEFRHSKISERCLRGVGGKTDAEFFSTQLLKNRSQVRIKKLRPFYQATAEFWFRRCGTD
jgi:hypothetical protein